MDTPQPEDAPFPASCPGWSAASLAASDAPARTYDVALLDLDGVLYVGDEPVSHAAEALTDAKRAGMRWVFVTNNALRTPQQVASRLVAVGVEAASEQVVTSAQAAARLISARIGVGARVMVTGGEGLREAVLAAGLSVVSTADDRPDAVVLGYDPSLDYARLAEAALAVRRGALYVACNRDATIPTSRGLMAGMGALAAFVATAAGTEPVVAGKPERALHAESVRRSGARRPLVVGDRLDTDVEGARCARTPSLLVLTGVTDKETLALAPPERRPDLLSADLRGLLTQHPLASAGRCRDATAAVVDGTLVLQHGAGLDLLRAAVTAVWTELDAGRPAPDLRALADLDV